MLNKYQFNGTDLKEYKVSRVKQGKAKNGNEYTVFQIADKIKQPDGTNKFDNYSIFTWQPDINLADGDKIVLTDIKGLEVKESEWNGTKKIDKTVFADIKITQSNATPKQPEVVDNGVAFDPIDPDSLPF